MIEEAVLVILAENAPEVLPSIIMDTISGTSNMEVEAIYS